MSVLFWPEPPEPAVPGVILVSLPACVHNIMSVQFSVNTTLELAPWRESFLDLWRSVFLLSGGLKWIRILLSCPSLTFFARFSIQAINWQLTCWRMRSVRPRLCSWRCQNQSRLASDQSCSVQSFCHRRHWSIQSSEMKQCLDYALHKAHY